MVAIEHEKRKREILKCALEVFIEEGYEGVTFQKIADRCGLTRTTLYVYFRSKREIFILCIKQVAEGIYCELQAVLSDKSLSAEDCLRLMLSKVVDCVAANSQLFSVLLVYLLQLKDDGINPRERIMRRILRLRHLLSTVIIRGVNNGEFKQLVVRDANDMFFGIIESVAFHLSLYGGMKHDKQKGTSDVEDKQLSKQSINEVRTVLRLAVDGILKTR